MNVEQGKNEIQNESVDQAAGLRTASWEVIRQGREKKGITRTISITSGKGGAGKTLTTLGIAYELVQRGRSVLVLDGDLSLANIDVMLGIKPKGTLADVLNGTMEIEDIVIEDSSGVAFLPATSGVPELSTLDWGSRNQLLTSLERVASKYEYLLVDTQAGIGEDVLQLSAATSEIICVVNPEPTSLTDAYALMKVLAQKYGERKFSLIVNNVTGEDPQQESEQIYRSLTMTTERYLQVSLRMLGVIPSDNAVREAIKRQRPPSELFPSSRVAAALRKLAERIDADFFEHRIKGGMQLFFEQIAQTI